MRSAAARVTRAAEGWLRRRFTVAEVEAMVSAGVIDEDERVELVGGSWFRCRRRETTMRSWRRRFCGVGFALRLTTSSWPRRRPSGSAKTPISSRTSSSTRARPAFKGLTGTNVPLVEIADSSLLYGMGRKAALYAAWELWVLDAVKLTARLFRDPAADGYHDVRDVAATDPFTPLFAPAAFALRLDELEFE
jgi:hypothetical protein